MILWSKGLGKLVLNMKLSERSATGQREGNLVIDGTMGAPTHWDYAVTMAEEDVLDFVQLLKQPAPVNFLIEGDNPGALVRTALTSGIVFGWNTARCFMGLAVGDPADSSADEAASGTATSAKGSE